jgi:hypothetical protein
VIDGTPETAITVITTHVERLREQAVLQRQLLVHLEALRARLIRGETASMSELMSALEAQTMVERKFTAEEQEFFRQRREEVGDARIKEVEEHAWPQMFTDVRAEIAAGTEPESARARACRSVVRPRRRVHGRQSDDRGVRCGELRGGLDAGRPRPSRHGRDDGLDQSGARIRVTRRWSGWVWSSAPPLHDAARLSDAVGTSPHQARLIRGDDQLRTVARDELRHDPAHMRARRRRLGSWSTLRKEPADERSGARSTQTTTSHPRARLC